MLQVQAFKSPVRVPADEFMRTVIDGAAAYERALIRARTTAALAIIRARGQKTGGGVPYGFRLDMDGRTLVAVKSEQVTVAAARALAAGGRSLRAVAAQLVEEGLVSRKGRTFSASQVARMLERIARHDAA
jgi:site-specific DNA recombinase